MRKRERGEPRREHTAAAAGEEEERRGEGERESQRITRREREREERGIDSTRHHDTTRWRRGHRQTGLTLSHGRDSADIP